MEDTKVADIFTKDINNLTEHLNIVINAHNKQLDKIEKLNKQIIIMEKYLELIHDLGYDYDGFNYEHDLKALIDEMVKYASLGRACNTSEPIFVDRDKQYNILNEEIEIKEGNNDK